MASRTLASRPWLFPLGLFVSLIVVYLPSLSGGFLNYDDPWLVQHNALLHNGSLTALKRVLFDLSRQTRLELGAEYLPVRDLFLWLVLRVSDDPRVLRAVQLAVYALGCLGFRHAMRRALGAGLAAEALTFAFALHPVHVESVAWLAGLKDVLALSFVAAALASYASESPRVRWLAPALLGLASLSKSMTVTAIGLLLAHDLLAKRRPRLDVLGAALALAAGAVALHVHVGSVVGMTQPPLGGSRFAAAATMGVVWLRYLALAAWPSGLSVVHDVVPLTRLTPLAVLGWATLAAWGAAGVWVWRRHGRVIPLTAFLWFVVPLVPVSQVAFPLQNFMTDRYLFLSVMAPALGIAALAAIPTTERGLRAARDFCLAAATAGLAATSSQRAAVFADSVSLFEDATAKTRASPIAPYQLAAAFEAQGDDPRARQWYEETLSRDAKASAPTEQGRRATNNLARVLVRHGDLATAEVLLRKGRERWNDDPKVLANLLRVTARQGKLAESRQLFDELRRRFPGFRPDAPPEPGP